MKTLLLLVCSACVLLTACTQTTNTSQSSDLDALLWSTASAESDAISLQVYAQAKRQLDGLLANPKKSAALEQDDDAEKLLPAIIVEVDETILSNAEFRYYLMAQNKAFNLEDWQEWVKESAAKPVPGALQYTNYAAEKGVTVFYVTNRHVSLFDATYRNLEEAGFPLNWGEMQLLMREAEEDWDWDKSSRRAFIAGHYRVVQIIGDSLGDFIATSPDMTPAQRRDKSASYIDFWGEKWFMLANPIYGDWESAIVGSSGGGAGGINDETRAKYQFIRGGESQGIW